MDFKPRVTEVDLHKVQMDAEQAYKDGFFCCEAVLESIMLNFNLDVPHELIRMTSAMSIGAGRSGCMCGAVNGGIAALGLLFGRDEKRGPKDPRTYGRKWMWEKEPSSLLLMLRWAEWTRF